MSERTVNKLIDKYASKKSYINGRDTMHETLKLSSGVNNAMD